MPKRGFTLIEMIIATAVGALALTMVTMALKGMLFSVKTTTLQSELDIQAATIVDQMVKELKEASTKSTLYVGSTHQSITFAKCTGYTGGAATYGNLITYATTTNGNHFVLERREVVSGITQTQLLSEQLSTTARTVRSAQGVDYNVTGAYFDMSGSVLTVTVVLERSNYMLKENSTSTDDVMWASSQASVQMANN